MFSKELCDFVNDCDYIYKTNGTTDKIPVTIELIKNGNTKTYLATVEIEDNWSKYESNSLCINSPEIKKKILYEKFTSGFYYFEYKNGCLRFTVNDYQLIIYSR